MSNNPFVPPKPVAPPPEVELVDEVLGATVVSGPPSPEVAPVAHSQWPAWPRVEVPADGAVYVMSVRGGSGGSTVAAVLGDGFRFAGYGWPVAAGWTRPRPAVDVVAVCRADRKGIEAATELARQWAAGLLNESRLIGLVVVDDGPSLLDSQRASIKSVSRMTPHGWHLPWHDPWRVLHVAETPLPRAAKALRKSVFKAVEKSQKERSKK